MLTTAPKWIGAVAGFLARRWVYLAVGGALAAATITAGILNRRSWSWGDFPTWALAVGAIVTAVFAFLAFRKQSAEVTILQQQARDQQDLTAKQTPVLELQVRELKASLEQREREAAERHRDQARLISAVLGPEDRPPDRDPAHRRCYKVGQPSI